MITGAPKTLLKEAGFAEIDLHFAGLLGRLSGNDSRELFLAAALVSRTTREGHVCLDLSTLEGKTFPPGVSPIEGVGCPGLAAWRKALQASDVVGRPGDFRPLILDGRSRLYLYRYWDYEQSLAEEIKKRASRDIERIHLPILKKALLELFPEGQGRQDDWQRVAAFTSAIKRFSVISGGPGTGKTTVAAKILAMIQRQQPAAGLKVALAAPTGKAALRLQQTVETTKEGICPEGDGAPISMEAFTLHRLLGTIPASPYFRHHQGNPLPFDVVVVDEASMADVALMAKLVRALNPETRLILLGDKDQLASVEAGAVLGDVCGSPRIQSFSRAFCEKLSRAGGNPSSISITPQKDPPLLDCVVELQRSFRFAHHSGIGAVSQAVKRGEGQTALFLLKTRNYDDLRWRQLPSPKALRTELREVLLRGYGDYLSPRDPSECLRRFEKFRILCALRRGPYGLSSLNALAEFVLWKEDLIVPDRRWYPGRPIIITRNDYNLGLFNGDIGMVLPAPNGRQESRVYFSSPEGTLREFLPTRLPEHETAYCMTVHKSQGSEFEEALLILPDRPAPLLTRELIYTGLSRARHRIEIWTPEEVFVEAVTRKTTRSSGLRDALWGWDPGGEEDTAQRR